MSSSPPLPAAPAPDRRRPWDRRDGDAPVLRHHERHRARPLRRVRHEVNPQRALIDALLARGELRDYHLAHSARADLYRRLGRCEEARAAYEQAHALAKSEPEKRYLEKRLRELD